MPEIPAETKETQEMKVGPNIGITEEKERGEKLESLAEQAKETKEEEGKYPDKRQRKQMTRLFYNHELGIKVREH